MKKKDREALFDLQTSRVAIDMVTLEIPSKETIRLCKNSEDIKRGLYTYHGCGMEVSKPEKSMESKEASGTLRLSGIGSNYIQLIQELSPETEITMTVETVFADNPTEIIDGPYVLKVNQVTLQTSTGTLEISCSMASPLDYVASTVSYVPKGFPGLWT